LRARDQIVIASKPELFQLAIKLSSARIQPAGLDDLSKRSNVESHRLRLERIGQSFDQGREKGSGGRFRDPPIFIGRQIRQPRYAVAQVDTRSAMLGQEFRDKLFWEAFHRETLRSALVPGADYPNRRGK